MKSQRAKSIPRHQRSRRPLTIADHQRSVVWRGFVSNAARRPARLAFPALKGLAFAAGQLARAAVVVVGLGAVGGRVFQELARLGVGCIIGIDLDRYSRWSVLTQPSHWADRGRSKAGVQLRAAQAISPAAEIWTVQGMAQDVPLWVYRQADVIIVSGDNIELSFFAGAMAIGLGKPLIELAVSGELMAAFVRHFDLSNPAAACPACNASASEWSSLKSRHGCDVGSVVAQGREATRTQPMTCALAAQLGVAEVLKILAGADAALRLRSEELIYTMLSSRSIRTPLTRNPECPMPHSAWRLVDCRQAPSEITFGEIVGQYERLRAESGHQAVPVDVLQVRGEQAWASYGFCDACGEKMPVQRFGRAGMTSGACRCGSVVRVPPMGVRSVLPPSDVRACADRTLADLGLPCGGALSLAYDDTWTHFFMGDGRAALLAAGKPRPGPAVEDLG
jgi:molybdopterin/thiamine biosynthesis adenylyltransferase